MLLQLRLQERNAELDIVEAKMDSLLTKVLAHTIGCCLGITLGIGIGIALWLVVHEWANPATDEAALTSTIANSNKSSHREPNRTGHNSSG